MKFRCITLIILATCFFQVHSQSDWQLKKFEFNLEYSYKKNDTIYKFQYTYDQPDLSDNSRWYYWFDTIIHKTKGAYIGKLLDGDYLELSKSGSLIAKGRFLFGLKDWTWKYWYTNGQLKRIENWKQGVLHGDYREFDDSGELIFETRYSKGLLDGDWVIFTNDTISEKRVYKQGKEVIPETKKGFWKRNRKNHNE
jgi:antitoxin component YwqK of YwqJK toxin-antitoxin module